MRTKWDYKVLKLGTHSMLDGVLDDQVLEEALNVLGEEGWELVGSLASGHTKDGTTNELFFLLKRPKV